MWIRYILVILASCTLSLAHCISLTHISFLTKGLLVPEEETVPLHWAVPVMLHAERRSVWRLIPELSNAVHPLLSIGVYPPCAMNWAAVPVAWGVGSHKTGINAKFAWRTAWFLLSELGYFWGWVSLYGICKFSWPGLFWARGHQRRDNRNHEKLSWCLLCFCVKCVFRAFWQ